MPKLTKRFIDSIKPDDAGKDKFLWDSGDGSIKGFGIRIKPSGAASYLVQYRNQEGRTRRMVIGKVGTLAPEEARSEAKKKLAAASSGSDPSAERHDIRKSLTVAELCDIYIKAAEGRVKSSTLAMDKSRIECHVKPLLGNRAVKGLTLSDIEHFQLNIAAGKTAKKREKKGRSGSLTGGRGVAARTVGMLGTILEFARRRKIISENPVRGVKKFEDGKNKRFLSIEEIAKLGVAIRESETENKTGIAAIVALLLTGCRSNEILALPWDWLDTKARCIRFEDTKTGEQTRPIGISAVNHLSAQPHNSDKWIFPADRGDGHFIGLPRVLERLCEKAELKDVTQHILRHSFASIAAELGYSELTIAGLIGHKMKGSTARYTHLPDRALLTAADAVSAHIMAALNGKVESAEVIDLAEKRSKENGQ